MDALASTDSRRVLDYSDLWNAAASTSTTPAGTSNGGKRATSASSRSNGWAPDGSPQTSSSSRKLRKILTMIGKGDVVTAEKELSTMGAAKNNFEIQRALVMAKTGRSPRGQIRSNNQLEYSEAEWNENASAADGDNEIYEDEDWDEVDDEEGTVAMETSFDWQGTMNGNSSGRQLTHDEIWDDSALIDAWNAAEEEYNIFHARRAALEKERSGDPDVALKKFSAADEVGELNGPKKRSALWHDSPVKGSDAALAAIAAQQGEAKMRAELEERKKHAKLLLARAAGDDISDTSLAQIDGASRSSRTIMNSMATTAGETKRRKMKGVIPPSSSIAGNLAWHSACATVSKTPNEIGASKQEIALAFNDSEPPKTVEASVAAGDGEEIFQNLAMAWYYAGYYQAMAAQWTAGQGRQ